MGRMTFVFEFEDGKEPEITEEMHFVAGKVVAASDADLVHAVTVMDKKIDEYKEREKRLIDVLNETSDPMTKKELYMVFYPLVLTSLFCVAGVFFGVPVLVKFLIHWFW